MTEAPEQPLRVEEVGRVLVLTMDRPRARNAMSLQLSQELAAAFDLLDARDDLSVAVVTGAGGTFCAGMDLKGFARGELPIVPGRGFAGIVERPPRKPVVAAVEGYALAGGFEIVLACDLVVAARTATFGLPEVKRGLTANAGGLFRLHERIPRNVAMELVLTGRMLPAEEAGGLGLVNRLCEQGRARDTAVELAEEIARNAPLALATSKRVMTESADWAIDEQFAKQHPLVQPIRESDDAREGARAFIEKRDPVWTGR